MCRERDTHFQPWISVPEHIIFTNYQKIRSGASPFYIFGGFCRSRDQNFQNLFDINPFNCQLSPHTKLLAAPRVSSRPECQPEASWQFRSVVFYAQNRSKLLPEPPFSSSKRLKLVPEPRIFTLDRELVAEPLPIFHFATAHLG